MWQSQRNSCVMCHVTPFFVEQLSTKGRHNLIHLCEKLCPTCSTSVNIPTILTLQQQAPHHQPKQQKKLCTQSPPVLPTRPIYRQTAVFQTLGADRNFGEIGCRFFADRNFGKNSRISADFWQIWPIFGRFSAIFGCKN